MNRSIARFSLAVVALVALVGLAPVAFGYTGATVTAMDVQPSDVPGPQPITVFPPPAAANMTGAQLIFDSSALLQCSSGNVQMTDRYWITWPLIATGIQINNMGYDNPSEGQGGTVLLGVDNDGVNTPPNGYFTNMSEEPTDNRYPARIPRVSRYAGYDFMSVQFVLDNPVDEFGVYVSANTNQWQSWPYSGADDDNNVKTNSWAHAVVFVMGETDDFSTAQLVVVDIPSMYAPFIHVVSNGTDPIKSVTVVDDSWIESGPPWGFFDVYVVGGSPGPKVGDITGDGLVNVSDLQALAAAWNTASGDAAYNADADLNGDGYINVGDLQIVVANWDV